ncbi:MAG: O-antigen ligase family protein [Chthonomonas sp.]|nr:O-antigen ligase family protein [Chthonomonas sp.]
MSQRIPLALLAVVLALATVTGGFITVEPMPVVWSAILGSLPRVPELPTTVHFMLGLVPVSIFGLALARRRVTPTPNLKVLVPLMVLLGLLFISVIVSVARYISFVSFLEWATAATMLGAILVTAGRERGPRLLLAAIAVGGVAVSLVGIQEYAGSRALDPNWRIFGGWINQNVYAAVLNLCFFSALAWCWTGERVARLLAILGAGIILFALYLTQSRGGVLSIACGLLVCLLLPLRRPTVRQIGSFVAPLIVAAVLVAGVLATKPGPKGGGTTAGPRILGGGAAPSNSADFRKLLWKSAITLAKENPAGSGLNTFQYVGTKPGLVSKTQLAHSSYLQLAAEATPFAAVTFVVVLVAVMLELGRRSHGEPEANQLIRSAVLGAIVAAAVHNQFDSLLYHFEYLLLLFGMIGIGLQVAADGSSPEVMPKPARIVAALGCGLLVVLLGKAAMGEVLRGTGLAQISSPEGAAAIRQATALNPGDGMAMYLESALPPTGAENRQIELLRQAAAAEPRMRYYRALSQAYLARSEPENAMLAIRDGLRLDPYNLDALNSLRKIAISSGDDSGAQEVARQMIEAEKSTTFTVRAIPEIVPTETAEARQYLAGRSLIAHKQAVLLEPAWQTLVQFATVSDPFVRNVIGDDSEARYAGESLETLSEKRTLAIEIGRQLARAYRDQNLGGKAAEVEGVLGTLFKAE